MSSVKKNFLYSGFLTSANYIFPLLTFPYVTRVLGVNNLGICDFVDSIINYFIMLSSMGIAVVGIREIAAHKSNKENLSSTFLSLISLNGIFTFCSLIILAIATLLIPQLYAHGELMIFGAFKITFNFLLIEWFYKGLEDFKYITIRTLFVKCLYVISVFIFVRNSDDYPIYYLLSVLMIGINAMINIIHSKTFVLFSFTKIRIIDYLKPLLIYGAYTLLTSFYTTFNIAYLGFATTTTQVGFYTTATKLYSIFIAIFSAFTGVMMPRMSALLVDGKIEEFKALYSKSIDVLATITIPAIFFTIIMAPQIVSLIAGDAFDGAILPMRIVMPLLFIIGYEQVLVVQALMPLKKDNIVLRNSFIGACVGIIANIMLVSKLGSVGSAIVWVTCEITVLILSQIAIQKLISEKFPVKIILKNLVVYIPILGIYWLTKIMSLNAFFMLIITGSILIVYFLIVQLYIFPDNLCGRMLNRYLPVNRH